MTEDGEMHVQQATSAVYDTATAQWMMQLTCGVFTDLGLPPVDVVWTVCFSRKGGRRGGGRGGGEGAFEWVSTHACESVFAQIYV